MLAIPESGALAVIVLLACIVIRLRFLDIEIVLLTPGDRLTGDRRAILVVASREGEQMSHKCGGWFSQFFPVDLE